MQIVAGLVSALLSISRLNLKGQKREPRETKGNANPSTPHGGSGGGGRRGAGRHNKYTTNASCKPRKEKAKKRHERKR